MKLKEAKFLPQIFQINPIQHIVYEEFVENGRLTDYLEFSIPEILIRTLFKRIFKAAEEIYKKSLIHGNLICDNILLNKSFDVKLVGMKNCKSLLSVDLFDFEDDNRGSDLYRLGELLCKLLFKDNFSYLKQYLYLPGKIYGILEFDLTLAELVSNQSDILEINSQDNLKDFIRGLFLGASFEDLKEYKWINDEQLDQKAYLESMENVRVYALQNFYGQMKENEKKLLTKVKGVFKVIK